MSSVSAAIGSAAAPIEITYSGGKATFNELTFGKVISPLEQWLIDREMDVLISGLDMALKRGVLTPDQIGDRIQAFVDDAVNKGRYSFGSKRMMDILGAASGGGELTGSIHAGVLKLISLMCGVDIDEVINLMAEKKLEVTAKLKLALMRGSPEPGDMSEITGESGKNLKAGAA